MTAAQSRESPMTGAASRGAGIFSVLSASEYSAIWSGQFLSTAGDQWARVALTILVYERTRSPLWTAFTYAGTYLPWLLGGLVLSAAADRFPRRTVLLSCDLARCVLVTVMALPGIPLPATVGLLFVVTLLQSPFLAARSATLRDILPGSRYPLGVAIAKASMDLAMVTGFASGGLLVGAVGARPALAADAATFAISAACIWLGVTARPAAAASAPRRKITDGIRLVFHSRVPRTMMLFGGLVAFYSAPEALAVPYAARFGGGPDTAGLLFAAAPLGAVAAVPAFTRAAGQARQMQWMAPMAAFCCLLLVLCLARPGLAWSLVIFAASGALSAYQVAANTRFVQAVPPERRGQAFGVAGSLMWTAQGVAFLLAGAAATAVSPPVAIAIFGGVGAIVAAVLAVTQARGRGPAGDPAPPR